MKSPVTEDVYGVCEPPLAGFRVLDLGRYIAAPLCAAMLADEGAEVIRIEPPEGASDRDVMSIGVEEGGGLYMQMNRNKKSLTLDFTTEQGRLVLDQLIATCDVVIVNLPLKALRRLGLDYESLSKIKENIILTTISAFSYAGEDCDRVGFDGTGQALSGAMYLTGTGERPTRAAVSYVDYATGMSAAFSTISAIMSRAATGEGQHVQVSLMGTALTMMNPMLMEEATGARRRTALANRSPIAGPSDLFRVSDGWVMVQVIGSAMFARWCELLGRSDLVGDPRFATDTERGENGEELSALMAVWCQGRTTAECLAELEKYRIPGCPALRPVDTLGMKGLGDYVEFLPVGNGPAHIPLVSGNCRYWYTAEKETCAAPTLGANTEEILHASGYTVGDISKLKRDGVI